MYCSSCGVSVAQGLSFCNNCGARLKDATESSDEVRPGLLVAAMAITFIFGTVAITMFTLGMKAALNLPSDRLLLFALLPFLVMLLLEGVFVRLLFRRKRGADEARDTETLRGQTTRELDAAHARTLPEHMPSVTENTTRAFAPINTDRK